MMVSGLLLLTGLFWTAVHSENRPSLKEKKRNAVDKQVIKISNAAEAAGYSAIIQEAIPFVHRRADTGKSQHIQIVHRGQP
jgi:hypothetical protein